MAAIADPKGVSGLVNRGRDPAAAKAVAQQFGALLMQNLMQQTDGTALPIAGGVGGGGVNTMFASTMGRAAMSGERLGLTDMLLRSIQQKQRQAGGGTADGQAADGQAVSPSGANAPATATGMPSAPGGGFPLLPYWQGHGLRPLGMGGKGHLDLARAAATTTTAALPLNGRIGALMAAAAHMPAPVATIPTAPSTPPSSGQRLGGPPSADIAAFVERIGPALQQASRQLGVSPRILLAQAAIETGWGRSMVGNNLFGIKSGSSWSGERVNAATHEYENGRLVSIRDNFRAYPNLEASVQDLVSLIANSRRYQAAIGSGDDAGAYARALLAGGWATDIDYVRKLEAVAGSRHAVGAFAAPGHPIPLLPPPPRPAPAVAPSSATVPL